MEILRGKVIRGEQIGEKQGYPTANLSRRVLANKKISNGVYVAETKIGNKIYKSLLVVGVPGIKKQKVGKVEVYFLKFKGNLYGQQIEVKPLKKIRPLFEYDEHIKLIARIKMDIRMAENYFKSSK